MVAVQQPPAVRRARRGWRRHGPRVSPSDWARDWSPRGSKNLLGELKVAWLYNQQHPQRPVQHARPGRHGDPDAAAILKWQGALGTIGSRQASRHSGHRWHGGDPYDTLVRAKDTSIRLVMINGVARYGMPAVMTRSPPDDETVQVGGQARRLCLKQQTCDPDVARSAVP